MVTSKVLQTEENHFNISQFKKGKDQRSKDSALDNGHNLKVEEKNKTEEAEKEKTWIMSGCKRQGTRLCQETVRRQWCRDPTD